VEGRPLRRKISLLIYIFCCCCSTLPERPKPLLTVQPEPSQIFIGDKVTLTCDIQGEGWTYTWQCGGRGQASKKKEFNITAVSKQKCKCCYKLTSVKELPKPAVRVQPDGHVFRGQTVTLTCDIQETDVSSWSYSWNKDDSVIHVSQSQEYRISSVNESHTGNYSCTGRETQGSRYSHTSDKVTLTVSGENTNHLDFTSMEELLLTKITPLSVLKLLSFLLAASPYLLVSVILGVKCYRAHGEISLFLICSATDGFMIYCC
uniref:Ig-like domain-containing protein n=1 Tax=Sinocyclocheilus anshuiensis TaxID=1608454 RepID=A0A671SS04_9TELE